LWPSDDCAIASHSAARAALLRVLLRRLPLTPQQARALPRLAPFFAPLVWAAILALTFYPLTFWLTAALQGRRSLASAILVVAVIAVVVLPAIYLGSLLVSQTGAAYERVQQMARDGELGSIFDQLRASRPGRFIETLIAPIRDKVQIDPTSLVVSATNLLSQKVAGQAGALAKNVLFTVVDFILMLVALFFFFRDGERISGRVRELIPMQTGHKQVIFGRLYDTLTAVVQGMVLTAVAQGVLAGIGYYFIANLSFSLFLAFLTGLASFIPLAGPALIWGGVAIYLAAIGEVGRAIGMAAWGATLVSTVDNVIKTLVIGGRARLPTFLLLFALLGGLQVYGFLGVFLAPVILATLLAFTDIYREIYAAPAPAPPALDAGEPLPAP
jgi:predicted PurR-regulated permease PerM